MKIVVGCLYHETNTFHPMQTSLEDFVFAEGQEVLERLPFTRELIDDGVEVIPSIYATGLPSGIVKQEAYAFFKSKIIAAIAGAGGVDGIWLHLHGAMVVEGIGSGELDLVRAIKRQAGPDVPLSLTLDIHGNLPENFGEYVNIVRAYRTVPHVDQHETERITARLLMEAIRKGQCCRPAYVKLPFIVCGEKALGNSYPLKDIFERLGELERMEGVATASMFLGHAWSDSPHTGASLFVVPDARESEELAQRLALQLKAYIEERKDDFRFSALALEPVEAVETSLTDERRPIFVSDSGDNTTAGAPGFDTILLRSYLAKPFSGKKVLIAAIHDPEAFDVLNECEVGQDVSVKVGRGVDENSAAVPLQGKLKAKGGLLGYLNATDRQVGDVCTVSVGNVDVAVANRGDSFITLNHFVRAGLDLAAYDVVVVKQGYLFDELSKVAKLDILALTPGATYLNLKEINYQHIPAGIQLI